ncbi:uncharacterized protein NPIL_464231 [Nephila pilipes]|uniref:Uncharacterized protein n=1 Tax=Nephila pilipes TaxID=299642 RepID=A0A8X6T9K2_NEPPI|nr:uncharacterized protein NPIL_464231 [Nephila pilipes]
MESDPLFEHLIQELFPSYHVEALDLDNDAENYTPKGPLTSDLLGMFPKVNAVLEVVVQESWLEYIKRSRTLISSIKMYISHLMLICSAVKHIDDVYDKFLLVFASVTYLAEIVHDCTGTEFYKLTPLILTVFFENVLKKDFHKRGGWMRLEEHIRRKKYEELYDKCSLVDFELGEELKSNIRALFSPRLPSFESEIPLEQGIEHPMIVDLTRKAISLLNKPSLPAVVHERSISSQKNESDLGDSVGTVNIRMVNGDCSELKDLDLSFFDLDYVSKLKAFEEKVLICRRVEFGIADCFTMSDEILFRHLMDHLFSFYYEKFFGHLECNKTETFVAKGALTQYLFEMIATAVFVLDHSLVVPWVTLLKKQLNRMLSSPEMYVSYLMQICVIETELTTNICEKFVNVCGVVTAMGVYIYFTTRRKFYKLTPRILIVFFENQLNSDFKLRGGWTALEEYLCRQDYLQVSGESGEKSPKKVEDKLLELRRKNVSFGMGEGSGNYQLLKNLTGQVVSTLDSSLITELSLSSQEEKLLTSTKEEASNSKSLSELYPVGGRSLEIGERSISSERDKTPVENEEIKDIEAILSDIKNMFSEPVSKTTSSSSDESAKRLASNLGSFFERLKSNLERVVSILNLMQTRETGTSSRVKGTSHC